MRFKLYTVEIKRPGTTARGHIVAPTENRAAELVIDHDKTLGLTHECFSLERVDKTLPEERKLGLDDLLNNAPVCFASYCDNGWIAHTGPVEMLRLYRTEDPKGNEMFAMAPNIDIAAAVFSNTLLPSLPRPHSFSIYEALATLPADRICNIHNLLELGPIGIAEFDEEVGRWMVW